MTERLMVAVLKTVVRQRTGGSNPSSSVKEELVSGVDTGSFFMPKGDTSKDLEKSTSLADFECSDQSKVQSDESDNTPNKQENSKEILNDPDLGRLVKAWADFSEAIRVGIMAMIRSSLNEEGE